MLLFCKSPLRFLKFLLLIFLFLLSFHPKFQFRESQEMLNRWWINVENENSYNLTHSQEKLILLYILLIHLHSISSPTLCLFMLWKNRKIKKRKRNKCINKYMNKLKFYFNHWESISPSFNHWNIQIFVLPKHNNNNYTNNDFSILSCLLLIKVNKHCRLILLEYLNVS